MKKSIITSTIILMSFSIQSQSWWNSKKIKGNGNIITKTRSIKQFDEITVGGAFDVILIGGTEDKVTIKGEENIIPYIITEVNNGDLKINFKENTNINTTKQLVITIPFNEIDKISLNGSGKVTSKKIIKTTSLSLNLSGSGNINTVIETSSLKTTTSGSGNLVIQGTTDTLKCTITGSGSLKSYDLNANTLDANITGSGSLKINVATKINADIVGSGSVYYKGNPKYIDSNIIGSGDVIDRN